MSSKTLLSIDLDNVRTMLVHIIQNNSTHIISRSTFTLHWRASALFDNWRGNYNKWENSLVIMLVRINIQRCPVSLPTYNNLSFENSRIRIVSSNAICKEDFPRGKLLFKSCRYHCNHYDGT